MKQPASPESKMPTVTTSASRRRPLLLLAIMLLVVVGVPALARPQHIPEPFDHAVIEQFESAAPELVFLGNSLLDNRIDPDVFTELTGKPTVSLAIEGTAPGIWYLQLTNIVAAAQNSPATVFIFFHDDLITRPISFTGVEDRSLVGSLTHSNNSEYGTVQQKPQSIGGKIRSAFLTLYPIADSARNQSTSPISSIGAQIAGLSNAELTSGALQLFSFADKREQTAVIQQPKFHGTFDSRKSDSFLPSIIQQANTLNIELVIVRVAARPNNDGSPNEPETLAKYTTDLANYLEENSVRYIDMTGHIEDGAIDAAMYYDGYHLKNRFRNHYTEFFAEWLLADAERNEAQEDQP
jgi:hypothetical protein